MYSRDLYIQILVRQNFYVKPRVRLLKRKIVERSCFILGRFPTVRMIVGIVDCILQGSDPGLRHRYILDDVIQMAKGRT
jgi:hypothetical protein